MKKCLALILSLFMLVNVLGVAISAETDVVNIQFRAMDNIDSLGNEGSVTRTVAANHTEGNGAVKFEYTNNRTGGLFWYIYCDNKDASVGVNITGATHIIFDIYVSDAAAWTLSGDARINMNTSSSRDNNQCGQVNAADMNSTFKALQSGWNHVVLPLNTASATSTILHSMRVYFSSGTAPSGFYTIIDDIRFVNQTYLDSNEYADITAAKDVIAAISVLTADSSEEDIQAVRAAYNALSDSVKAYVTNAGNLDNLEPGKPEEPVNIQFRAMDSAADLMNEGHVTRTVIDNYLEGDGAVQFLHTKDRSGGLFWYIYCDNKDASAGMDITGATHITFDLYVSDITKWTLTGDTRINMNTNASRDNNQCGQVKAADMNTTFKNLQNGWNHIIMPIDTSTATSTTLHSLRMYFSSGTAPAGFYTVIDDVRFVNQAYLDSQDGIDYYGAKEVVADIIGAYESMESKDITEARTTYNALSDAAKEMVFNFSVLLDLEEEAAETGGVTFKNYDVYRVKDIFDSAVKTLEVNLYLPNRSKGKSSVILGTYGSNYPAINFEITGNGEPKILMYHADDTVNEYLFADATVPFAQWTHLAFVWDETAGKIHCYVDGEQKQSLTFLGDNQWLSSTTFAFAGDYTENNPNYFKGRLKTLAVYDDMRTADEIKADMTAMDTDGLMAYYDLDGLEVGYTAIEDKSGNENPVVQRIRWMSEGPEIKDYAYSFAFVGDTQYMNSIYPEQFHKIYDWLVENVQSKKMEFVFGLGDITQSDTSDEWELAMENIHKLDGLVPYNLVRGNHDGVTNFKKYVSMNEYGNTVDGTYNGDMLNTYKKMTVGEVQYLLLTLDYDPSNEVISWANQVVENHPGHNVIITTHSYLHRDRTLTTDGGTKLWENLVKKHKNIVMVVSGHVQCDDVLIKQTEGEQGNKIVQILTDHQDVDGLQKAAGMITMMYFSEDGRNVQVETYSTVQEQWFIDTNQFAFELDLVKDEEIAAMVVAQIEALTGENEATITAAREAYEALTDTQKALVNNLADLEQAEAALAALKADKAASDEVVAKIDALPAEVTAADEENVKAARAAYDALTESQQAMVTNLAKLEAAEAVFAIVYGDLNGDGKADASDALKALQHSVKLITLVDKEFTAGDVDKSGTIDATDALYILQYSVKLIDTLPVK